MKIIVIHKSSIESIPPVLSLIIIMTDLGYDVELVTCGISDANRSFLEGRKVRISILPYLSDNGIVRKIFDYLRFKNKAYSYLKKCNTNNDIILIEGAHTLVSLGKKFSTMGFRYILMLPEYIEKGKYDYQVRAIDKVIRNASAVLVPEYNRCHFYKIRFGLRNLPVVLPNKPYFDPELPLYDSFEKEYGSLIEIFKTKKVILYQGHVAESRDVSSVVRAVKELGGDYQMVLMGKDYGFVKEYKSIDANVIHVPFIPAPNYLYLTRLAYIGILYYDPYLFNTAYCAPNKIYEYAKYGLPVIGNNIPGIHYPLNMYKFGMDADFSNVNEIKDAILNISNNYEEYRSNSFKFFDSTDNVSTMKSVITEIVK